MDQFIHPAFHDCGNCIVLCSDDNYMALSAVAVQSILESRDPAEKYDIVFLHSGISEEHIIRYDKMFKGYEHFSVRFFNICELIEGRHFYIENRDSFSQATYYRLVLPWALDSNYHRALYIDGDMIVRHDITPVFQTDFEGKLIAAVRDYWGICNCYVPGDDRREYRESIGLHDIDDYVIAATVLFNLDEIRKKHTAADILRLCTSKQWRQHDQDVLNVLFYRQIKILSPTWGDAADYGKNHFLPQVLQAELSAIDDPAIFHFFGYRKPYNKYETSIDAEFWLIALHTSYFNALLKECRDIQRKLDIVNDIQKAVRKAESMPFHQICLDNLALVAHIKDLVCLEESKIHALRRDLEKQKKRTDKLQKDLACVHNSVSFRIGRGITWLPRKIRGVNRCIKKEGLRYTAHRIGEKLKRKKT